MGLGTSPTMKRVWGEPPGKTSATKYILNRKRKTSVTKDILKNEMGFGGLPRKMSVVK